MSDAVMEALEARAKGAPPAGAPKGDPVQDALLSRARGEAASTKPERLGFRNREFWDSALPRTLTETVPAGFNKGVTALLGLPADTVANAADLVNAGAGFVQSKVTGEAPTVPTVDRASTPGTSDWIASGLNRMFGNVTEISPDASPADRLIYSAASGVPGALTGGGGTGVMRQVGAGVAGGAAAQGAAEMGADPGTQALTALAVGAGAAVRPRGPAPGAAPDDAPRAGAHTRNRESVGAAAASPELQAASPELRAQIERISRESGINREVVTRHIEADSLPVKIRLTKGQATQDPTQLSLEQNARGKNPELARIFNEQNQQLIDNLDEIRATASPKAVGMDPVQNGQALIDAYKAADGPIRADINAKYKALEEANGGQFPLNGKDFASAADAALAKKMKGRYVPKEVAGDLAELRDGGPMTFETFENLRTNLAAEARKAERSGDGNAAMAINIVRESLESLPITGEAAKVKPLADAARAAAKARFDRLRADPAYRAAVDDGAAIGELSPLADDFITKHVVKAKAANLKEMRKNLAENPEAVETIAAGALNYLKSKSGVNLYTNEGNFSQAGYNRALSELTPKLDLLLDEKLAAQAQALGNVARYTQAQPRGAFVNNSNTFVAAAKEHAASTLEGVANVAAHGIPVGTMARKKLQQRAESKFVKESTEPAAGIQLKELMQPKGKK